MLRRTWHLVRPHPRRAPGRPRPQQPRPPRPAPHQVPPAIVHASASSGGKVVVWLLIPATWVLDGTGVLRLGAALRRVALCRPSVSWSGARALVALEDAGLAAALMVRAWREHARPG